MLSAGGSYVSLVSPGGCGDNSTGRTDLTIVVQTMSYGLSKCFKDSHAPFTVEPQTAAFKIAAEQSQNRGIRGGGKPVCLKSRKPLSAENLLEDTDGFLRPL